MNLSLSNIIKKAVTMLLLPISFFVFSAPVYAADYGFTASNVKYDDVTHEYELTIVSAGNGFVAGSVDGVQIGQTETDSNEANWISGMHYGGASGTCSGSVCSGTLSDPVFNRLPLEYASSNYKIVLSIGGDYWFSQWVTLSEFSEGGEGGESGMNTTVTAALTTGLTSFSNGITDIIAAVLPGALGVLVLIAGISFGVKFFRRTARV